MKKLILQSFFALVIMTVFCGCSFKEINRNLENSRKLRVGMTKEQVLSIMGEPLRNAFFHEENVWYYFVRINWYDGLYTRDECMPLVFKDDKLTGWGNEYKARLDNVAPKKPFIAPEQK
jgi:outer membrane protein assembly factor BamE (lipoprotein component of BamABCDE complex)